MEKGFLATNKLVEQGFFGQNNTSKQAIRTFNGTNEQMEKRVIALTKDVDEGFKIINKLVNILNTTKSNHVEIQQSIQELKVLSQTVPPPIGKHIVEPPVTKPPISPPPVASSPIVPPPNAKPDVPPPYVKPVVTPPNAKSKG